MSRFQTTIIAGDKTQNRKVEWSGALCRQPHWLKIREDLLNGDYKPLPVKRKEISKPDGGVRLLGIPTVLDRLIQQAIARVLQQIWDPTFSNSSFGFRPGRSQRQAIRRAKSYLLSGYKQG